MQHPAPVLACALALLASAARAQEARSLIAIQADSNMQMAAASLIPTLRGRWLHADQKLVVGRVRDVRVSQDGHTLIAVVSRRRWLGGGEIGIPVPRLHQRDNDLTVSGTRDEIRHVPVIGP
ncbi:PRC-barrel domain containing protein (plasmid) [Methylobacterium sp. OT2]|nr:PRC-barrel domain containing protein [Methylobacterium sp. OT2]